MLTLQEELDQLLANVVEQLPSDVLQTSSKEMEHIYKTQLPTGLAVGQVAPDFALPDPVGHIVTLSELRQRGPVILSFYRGEWCPYCNLELRALQRALPEFSKLDAQLVAISPQTPDHSLSLKEKHELEFPVVSDPSGRTLRDYNLLYEFSPELIDLYQHVFGVDLTKFNGTLGWQLPVPATLVVDRSGVVQSVSANMDYTKRMNPEDIVQVIKALADRSS